MKDFFLKKYIIFFLIILFVCSCDTYKRSYSQRRGLMLLKTNEQPRNKKMQEYRYHRIKN